MDFEESAQTTWSTNVLDSKNTNLLTVFRYIIEVSNIYCPIRMLYN